MLSRARIESGESLGGSAGPSSKALMVTRPRGGGGGARLGARGPGRRRLLVSARFLRRHRMPHALHISVAPLWP